jgi:hypothetical protein
VDLHLEIAYSDYEYFMRDEFFPNLSWMALLKNFVILKRGGLYTETIVDECVEGLVKWVFSYYDMNCVERVWIKIEDCGIPCDMIPSECQLKHLYAMFMVMNCQVLTGMSMGDLLSWNTSAV